MTTRKVMERVADRTAARIEKLAAAVKAADDGQARRKAVKRLKRAQRKVHRLRTLVAGGKGAQEKAAKG